jgi:diguanylate cyclase (GGDEF)-like protein/PAS domain S-box-containing protein
MKFDIRTLAFIQCLVFFTQSIVLFTQYRVNKTYRGIGWWVLGSFLMSLGVIFMPLVEIKSLLFLAMIANPLVVLGQVFLYIGMSEFLNKNENRRTIIIIFAIFIISYYYYMFFNNSISGRTVAINVTLALISIMIAYKLFLKKDKFISGSANFTASVFLIYGLFLLIRASFALILPTMHDYSDQEAILIIGFIVPTIISTLWTFGFIIMLNQRLNVENLIEKEKLQQIFNTIPDAALITRLKDGLIIDVNDRFSLMTGYPHDEVIGEAGLRTNLWHTKEEREIFVTELTKTGICENKEFVFERKDKSLFDGIISARIITIYEVPHIVSAIHDITERKLAEQKIQQLVEQLEVERNTAQLNSITDSLTGLANRRHFDEALKTEFYRLKRSGKILSLIMLDIDYFKKFNDNYGHLAGDECLRQIGNMLNHIVGRAPDIVARYGGEEFVFILPETEEYGAKVMAERIRNAVEELAIPHATSDIGEYVTVSVGVVTVYTTDLASPEQVVKLVDEALYSAKKSGRNRIRFETNIARPENDYKV